MSWKRVAYATSLVRFLPVAELHKRIERWTQGRKISLCRGLCAKIITTSEVVLAHDLAQDEIDRWMEAYKRKDFEALKVGYRPKRRSVRALCRVPDRSGTLKSNLDVADILRTCAQAKHSRREAMNLPLLEAN